MHCILGKTVDIRACNVLCLVYEQVFAQHLKVFGGVLPVRSQGHRN